MVSGSYDLKEGLGYLECVTICQFVDSLFRSLVSMPLGFVSERELENGEEIEG